LQRLTPSRRQSKLDRTALAGREPNQASFPLRADPAAVALIGTVVLFGLLALPGSLILVLIVGLVIGIARSLRSRRNPKVDRGFAARFRALENSILDPRTSETRRQNLAQGRISRMPRHGREGTHRAGR
jgi:hypothetical protein